MFLFLLSLSRLYVGKLTDMTPQSLVWEEACGGLLYYSMSDEERRAYDEYLNVVMIQNDVLNTGTSGRPDGRL